MRRTAILLSSAALILAGCNKPAEHAEEPHGEEVAAGAVANPDEATVTMDQAAADAAAAAEAVQTTQTQAETPIAAATEDQAAAPAPAAPAAPAH